MASCMAESGQVAPISCQVTQGPGLAGSAAEPPARVVCLVLSNSYRLSLPVLDTLGVLEEQLRRSGVELWLVAVPSQARPQLAQDQLATTLGPDRILPSARVAADSFASAHPLS